MDMSELQETQTFRKYGASIRTKLFLIILFTSLFVLASGAYFGMKKSYERGFEGLRDELIATARTTAAMIDGNKHEQLAASGDDKSDLYIEIKDQLKAIKAANPKIRYVYTMVKTDKVNEWEFVVDAEEDPELISHLGDPFKVSAYPEMQRAFEEPSADTEITTDQWGDWLSGYAPIYNESGDAVAIVGLDMSANAVKGIIKEGQRNLLIPLGILLLLPALIGVLASGRLSRTVTEMLDAATKIAEGDYDQRIDVKTTDEIGQLAAALNKMAANISERVGSMADTAIVDGLTDLNNHRYFQERLGVELKRAERYNRQLALLMIDVDSFARFNAINGHVNGDHALRRIADIIKDCSRETDLAARYSGEEFVVVMPEADEHEAMMAAERIGMTVSAEQFRTKHNISIPLTVSIGITHYPKYGESRESLIETACDALAQAKKLGPNSIAYPSSAGYVPAISRVKPIDTKMSDEMIIDAVFSLAKAVDARDHYTHRHSEFVARYAARLGRAMGLNEKDVTNLSIAGLLHDIGKIGVPDAILNKLDTLTGDEWLYIDRHPVLGADIVRHLSGLREVVKTILHHHEKYDGTGYPDCLVGEEIPFKARIICVVDSYHAMISDRPYRAGLSRTEALTELNRCRETHFDPRIVDKFIELIEKEGVAGGSQDTAGSNWNSVSA